MSEETFCGIPIIFDEDCPNDGRPRFVDFNNFPKVGIEKPTIKKGQYLDYGGTKMKVLAVNDDSKAVTLLWEEKDELFYAYIEDCWPEYA